MPLLIGLMNLKITVLQWWAHSPLFSLQVSFFFKHTGIHYHYFFLNNSYRYLLFMSVTFFPRLSLIPSQQITTSPNKMTTLKQHVTIIVSHVIFKIPLTFTQTTVLFSFNFQHGCTSPS